MSQIKAVNEAVVSVRGLTVESRKLAGVIFFALAAQFMTIIITLYATGSFQ